MPASRPYYLIERLISNKLSQDELEELLAGIGEEEMTPEYSAILERYFNQLLVENNISKLVSQKVNN